MDDRTRTAALGLRSRIWSAIAVRSTTARGVKRSFTGRSGETRPRPLLGWRTRGVRPAPNPQAPPKDRQDQSAPAGRHPPPAGASHGRSRPGLPASTGAPLRGPFPATLSLRNSKPPARPSRYRAHPYEQARHWRQPFGAFFLGFGFGSGFFSASSLG